MKILYRLAGPVKWVLRNVFPMKIWLALKTVLPGQFFLANMGDIYAKEWRDVRDISSWYPGSQNFEEGVNLVGYFRTVKGISEAARSSAMALDNMKIPFTVNDYEFGVPAWQQIDTLPNSPYGSGFKFNTNLIHVNPPQLPFLWNTYKEGLTARYNIGVWYWELPEFPDEWSFAFGLVDEIWVATQFILDGFLKKSPIPVVKIPPCIHAEVDPRLTRTDYNLPADCFLFMCAYDVLSIQMRKNPLGAVNAFIRAFKKNDSSVGLVIKVNNAQENPQEIRQLREHVAGYSNCYIIEDVLDKLRFNSLLNTVDAFISLHRSEGFGLIPAEAMSFGKPVIMTRWSGNLDFMTPDNSCGVNYKLIPVGRRSGPYMPDQFWADPDVEHASFFMQKLASDQTYYTNIAIHAKKTIQDDFSPQRVGQIIRKRMQTIGLIS